MAEFDPKRCWPPPHEPIERLVRESQLPAAAAAEATTAAALFARANARAAIGQFREARDDLADAQTAFPAACAVELAMLDIRERGSLHAAADIAREHAGDERNEAMIRARAYEVLGLAEGKLRVPTAAIAALLEASRRYRELRVRKSMARVEDILGQLFSAEGQLEIGLTHYSISLVDKVADGDLLGVAMTLGNIGRAHLRAGRFKLARECFERDLELSEKLGDRIGVLRMMQDIGRTFRAEGDAQAARNWLERAVQLAVEDSNRSLEFFARKELALVRAACGDLLGANSELDAASKAIGDGGEPYLKSLVQAARGELLLASASTETSSWRILREAADEFERLTVPDEEITVRLLLAGSLSRAGRQELALAQLERALLVARRDGYARYLPVIREQLARNGVVRGLEFESGRSLGTRDDAIEGYVLVRELGAGGCGRTYLAFDPRNSEVVAAKVLHLDSVYAPEQRKLILDSSRRELEVAARLRHPGFARVRAMGTDPEGTAYVISDFVRGRSLRKSMSTDGTAAEFEVVRMMALIAHSLAVLHDAGLVHRDLKPENVLVVERPLGAFPVLIDFGLAQDARFAPETTNFIEGTLEYMSPEQGKGLRTDGKSDIYSLGVMAFEWLTGVRPSSAGPSSSRGFFRRLIRADRASIATHRPALDSNLAQLIDSMLSLEPDTRPTAKAVAAASDGWLEANRHRA